MTSTFALIDSTWPAASVAEVAGWTIREGKGGGSRVSAATWDGSGTPDFTAMETACTALGQRPLVMVRSGEDALDQALEARGYEVQDPVVLLAAKTGELAMAPPLETSFDIYPPLAIQTEIWQDGGIGPDRLAVMDRVNLPKTTLFGRKNERPAGSAFVACDGDRAMLHALEIRPALRRLGLAQIMMRHAALWAQDQGAAELHLLVTRENSPARSLYASLNFQAVGHYHYRKK